MPCRAAMNDLHVVPVPKEVQLKSYLEEGIIAKALIFMYIFSLRTHMMYAVKDKCIVVPMEETDIRATVQSLPRLPSETGIIDVQWKRRMNQKNAHKQGKVEPNRIFNALEFLRRTKHPLYQNIQSREEYEENCKTNDPEGHRMLFGNSDSNSLTVDFQDDSSTHPIHNLDEYHQLLQENEEEVQLKDNDVIQKFQYNYKENTCMVEKFPEALQTEGVLKRKSKISKENKQENQLHIIAQGEGKAAINLLTCIDYEIQAFPMLFPDGKNHLTQKRERYISMIMYFQQRLFNKDPRWRRHAHWLFAAALYKENTELLRNINLGYKKGIKNTNAEGKSIYTLNDPWSIFQNITNTPTYHRKGKMEMMAKLDNFGPFHVFFYIELC
jgi:hypothetical protein